MKKKSEQTLTPKLRFPEFRDRWTSERLDQLADIITERAGDQDYTPFTVTTGVGLVSQQERFGRTIAGNAFKSYYVLRKDDFAYNKSATKAFPQGYIARFLQHQQGAVPNSIFTCFRVDPKAVNPAYLDYLFAGNLHGRWLRRYIEVSARAHGSLSVDDADLMALPVPLPCGTTSLAEQQKIADCLSSLDDLIAAHGGKLEVLWAHKKGLMRQLFPREGETRPRLRFPEFRDGSEWRPVTLGQLVEVASGQVDPTEPPHCDCPQVGSENIESDTGKLRNVKSAREKGVMSGNYRFDQNDILYSKIRPALNKVAAPEFKGICSADIYPIRPASGELLRTYLFYLLLSEAFLNYAAMNSARGKIPKINRDALLAYEALIPPPAEQQRIADCLCALDALIAAEAEKLVALKTHKKGLMQQLFPSLEGD